MAVMAAGIGGLALMGMMSLNVLERTREVGVMRSIGASSRAIGSIVGVEGLTTGIICWLLSIPLSVPISMAFNAMLGKILGGQAWAFVFSPVGLIAWLVIVLSISVIASIIPALQAMRMSIQETLAYE
jgi:putative ABC transport system permease protein